MTTTRCNTMPPTTVYITERGKCNMMTTEAALKQLSAFLENQVAIIDSDGPIESLSVSVYRRGKRDAFVRIARYIESLVAEGVQV